MTVFRARLCGSLALLAASLLGGLPAEAQSTPAKTLFAAQKLPAAMPTQSYGFYAKGCIAGAEALPSDGETWQAMRLSRNRRYGHPATIALIERLSRDAVADGWPGLLVGDIGQPRGGPAPSGHASHQIGLDADIWLQPMPNRRLSYEEREDKEFVSLLKKGSNYVDEDRWNPVYARLLKRAASYPEVQRIFVHPGIKKKLCETAGRDRSWLNKIRANWGHDSHFHIRLYCQPGSPGCEAQRSTGTDDGCDLKWWFDVALKPAPKPTKPAKPVKPKPPMTLADMPKACRAVLNAPDGDGGTTVAASTAEAPATIVPQAASAAALGFAPPPAIARVPIPGERPMN
ncbi:penicillin-insensitive murein endopeptidase [Mangrovicella endophytica]|uniref:penicillin-insensitive murein endopeptidase n=1 Tax=Mangrovicella endophytica TaxID=2066697 RepID=UPI000C9E556A|nr:penicillin-insensitive murein endopeptidase [Mangrovicella endophytica]